MSPPRWPPIQRFERFVRKEGACWIWTGHTMYGSGSQPGFWTGEREMSAARWAWDHFLGDVPERIKRTCPNPRCVNPEHYQDISLPDPPEELTRRCACGCGELTPRAWMTRRDRGWLRGHQMKYVPGHGKPGRRPLDLEDPMHRLKRHIRYDGECWIWTGAISSYGRGQMWFKGKMEQAHRVSYYLATGEMPRVVYRYCDNKACVNPAHHGSEKR
jgi:hypothetical protein